MMSLAKTAAAFVVDETVQHVRSRRLRNADTPVLIETGGGFRLFERKRGTVRHLADGSFAEIAAKTDGLLRRRAVELRIDPARAIDRTIRVPAASRNYAEAVVRHQLDRITPFAPGNVVFDFEELGVHGTGSAAEIELRVVVVARSVLAELRDACAAAGIRIGGIGVAGGSMEEPSRIDLAADAKAAEIARLGKTVRTVLSGLLLFGAVSVAASFLFVDFAARKGEALASRIEAARAEAMEQRRGAEQPVNPVLALKHRDTAMAVLINELSRVLPEDTYLTGLAVEDGKLRLTGLSTKASALIGPVEASSLFGGAAFTAPVLRGQSGGLERFEIVASFGGPVS